MQVQWVLYKPFRITFPVESIHCKQNVKQRIQKYRKKLVLRSNAGPATL